MSRPRNWVIAFTVFLMLGCSGAERKELVLNDFESDADLDRIHWRCHVLYSLSTEHATRGNRSLKMELYPSEYPGLSPVLKTNDWRRFKTLCFDVYNPGVKDLRLTLRIDDKKEANEYGDRYNGSFIVKPGWNRREWSLKSLLTSGTKRNLELSTIHRFLLFMVRPPEKAMLYVDNIRLVK